VVAVEMDQRFRPALSVLMDAALPRLSVVWADILKVDETYVIHSMAATTTAATTA
jgi:16S rRNA A1518/A1519 N6-dimethyltransferase RsmA/KsgA/DIM1 with predicted DNA glycosylase/AP lyase activity